MSPRRCEACDAPAQGHEGWICQGCERLLSKEHIDELNRLVNAVADAQDRAVAYLRRLRGAG